MNAEQRSAVETFFALLETVVRLAIDEPGPVRDALLRMRAVDVTLDSAQIRLFLRNPRPAADTAQSDADFLRALRIDPNTEIA